MNNSINLTRRSLSILPILLSAVVVSACGGDSGDQADGRPFALFPADYFSVAYNERYSVSGTDNQGQQYSGLLLNQTLPPTLFEGVVTTPLVVSSIINNNDTGATTTSTSTNYYRLQDAGIQLIGAEADATTLQLLSNGFIPRTANTGDSGAVGAFMDNAGNTIVLTWRLDNAPNNQAALVQIQTTSDQNDDITSIIETSQVIDSTGNRLSGEMRISFPGTGVEVTLTGEIE